jgi:hypothetical protein
VPAIPRRKVEELVNRIQAAGGTLTIADPEPSVRAEYRRALHAAKEHELVPKGLLLRYTGRDRGDLTMRLLDAERPDETDWNRIRLAKNRTIAGSKDVVAALRDNPSALRVGETSLPRALNLLTQLGSVAESAGHCLVVSKKHKQPKPILRIDGHSRTLDVSEEYDEVPHQPTPQELREIKRNPYYHHVPKVDRVRSGRLRIEVNFTGWGPARALAWRDEENQPLERRLERILKDISAQIAAEGKARAEAERPQRERVAAWEREKVEKRQRWEQAVAEAQVAAREKVRKDTFRAALDAWTAARTMRELCDALDAVASSDAGEEHPDLIRWIGWGRAEAEAIDPTTSASTLARAEFDTEPTREDLRPFLRGWHPDKPEREYQNQETQDRLTEIRESYIASWHPGLRNRPTWWRHR